MLKCFRAKRSRKFFLIRRIVMFRRWQNEELYWAVTHGRNPSRRVSAIGDVFAEATTLQELGFMQRVDARVMADLWTNVNRPREVNKMIEVAHLENLYQMS